MSCGPWDSVKLVEFDRTSLSILRRWKERSDRSRLVSRCRACSVVVCRGSISAGKIGRCPNNDLFRRRRVTKFETNVQGNRHGDDVLVPLVPNTCSLSTHHHIVEKHLCTYELTTSLHACACTWRHWLGRQDGWQCCQVFWLLLKIRDNGRYREFRGSRTKQHSLSLSPLLSLTIDAIYNNDGRFIAACGWFTETLYVIHEI